MQLLVGAPVLEALLPAASVDPVSNLTDLPSGVLSSVLLERPDILAAERRLIGAYASIGAARAAFFPSISLTAFGGNGERQPVGPVQRRQRGLDLCSPDRAADFQCRQEPGSRSG